MSSKTQIVNIALLRIGVSRKVANVDTEASTEAVNAKTVFDDERDYCLRDFPWPWATRYATLGLVAGTQSVPVSNDWTYSYRYPSDCIFVRRIVTGTGRKDVEPPPFRIGRDTDGRLIYSSYPDAEIEYTSRVTDPEEFDPLFISMLAWRMAASLSPSLSRVANIAATAMQMYEMDRQKAQTRALNEQQQDSALDAEWIRGR